MNSPLSLPTRTCNGTSPQVPATTREGVVQPPDTNQPSIDEELERLRQRRVELESRLREQVAENARQRQLLAADQASAHEAAAQNAERRRKEAQRKPELDKR